MNYHEIAEIVHRTLKEYRVSWVDEGSAELVDFLTPDGESSIDMGVGELAMIADEIGYALHKQVEAEHVALRENAEPRLEE